jgi:acyl-CoA dehydrogenase
MAEEVAASRMAAEAAFEGQPLEISERRAAIAKIRCGQAARVLCARAHAVHGAIGVSLEHPLHRYTRRLHTWSMSHGGEGSWSKILGDWALQSGDDFTTLSRLA